jgi:hypothetical protein
LVAVTVKVYPVPMVSPTTVAGLLVGVTPVQPPHAGDGITVYPVIAEPLVAGAVQLTVMLPLLFTVALTAVGAAGGSAGVTAFDAPEYGPQPCAFSATAVKVYGVPSVSPPTMVEDAAGFMTVPVQPPQ